VNTVLRRPNPKMEGRIGGFWMNQKNQVRQIKNQQKTKHQSFPI